MRLSPPIRLAFGLWLIGAVRLQAGLYNPLEPAEAPRFSGTTPPALAFPPYRDSLMSLMSLNQPISPLYKRYEEQCNRLEAQSRGGTLGPDQLAGLGAYLIRLRRYDQAVEVLVAGVSRHPNNFMLLANLASAFQLQGRFDRALSYLQGALDRWPTQWPGHSKEQLAWYKEAERYQLRLLKLRYREALRRSSNRDQSVPVLDDLFLTDKGSVRFLGPSGDYEAGVMSPAERVKLPANALAVAQQLSLWFPDDARLYWLVGEIYNAHGQIDASLKILEDCVWSRRFDPPELRQHRLVLQEARPKTQTLELEPATPIGGPAKGEGSTSGKGDSKLLSGDQATWLPGTGKLIAVGTGAGALILLLGYLQFREARRYRRTRSK